MGGIPESFYTMKNAEVFSFSWNDLSGPLSESIGNMTSLKYFSVGSNELSGPIPDTIGNLPQIEYIGLSSNRFEGEIPSSFQKLQNTLSQIRLDNNQLNGTLTVDLSQFQYFKEYTEKQLENYIAMYILDGNNITVSDGE